jgi:hypothetical protein
MGERQVESRDEAARRELAEQVVARAAREQRKGLRCLI